MIVIEERPAKKVPCVTSLFLSLPYVDKQLFRILIHIHGSVYDKKTGVFEFAPSNLAFLVKLFISKDDVRFIAYKAKNQEQGYISLSPRTKFKRKLFAHQRDAIEYGLNHNKWILRDDQGLGKTTSVICLADTLRKQRGIKHCLIVCGVNALKYTWKDEIAQASDLSACILGEKTTKTGKTKIGSISERLEALSQNIPEFFVITNVETLQNKDFAQAFKKSKTKFDMVVVDEIHRLKSSGSNSAKTLLKLHADYKVALTGTMIVNSPSDAYVPLKWTENIHSDLSTMNGVYAIFGGFGNKQIVGVKNLDLLREVITGCSLRRLKSDVLDLPPKIYKKEYVELLPKQRALYEEVQQKVFESLDKLNHKPSVIEEISMNLRLRQITASPSMLSTEVTESAKLQRLEELVQDIVLQGDKVVVFCSFKGTATEIYNRLAVYNPVVCTGDITDSKEVESRKQRFMTDNSCKVFIGTWQKMGTGHTLTAANYMIFVDTPFTDSDFQQSADRIYAINGL